MTTDFENAPEWARDVAFAKAEVLRLADEFIQTKKQGGKGKALEDFLRLFNAGHLGSEATASLRYRKKDGGAKKIKIRAVQGWARAYREKGVSGLVPRWGNGGTRIHPEARGTIEKIIWQNHLVRPTDLYDDLSLLLPAKKMPSYFAIRRFTRQYKKENWAALILKHEGQRGLRDRNMFPTLGRADGDLIEPLQRVEIDTTLADLLVKSEVKGVRIVTRDGKRCHLIAYVDDYSRMCRFFLTDHESGLSVALALKDCFQRWGIPQEVVFDRGRPYLNRRILTFLRSSGIPVHICDGRSPWQKGVVERIMRTVNEGFFRRLPGYVGRCVKDRPKEIEVSYTREETQNLLDRWTDSVYAEEVHRSTGQRPRERFAKPGFSPRKVREHDLDVLVMDVGERTVSQGVIRYNGGRYFNSRLPEGCKVRIRIDDFDASSLLVFHKGRYLCKAKDMRRAGVTPIEIREAKKERTRELKAVIKANELLLERVDVSKAGIVNLIAEREKTRPVELPRKAAIMDFPELSGVKEEHDPRPEEILITNAVDKFLQLMRGKNRGNVLSERDHRFLKTFTEDEQYRLLLPSLEEQLREEKEAANA